MISLRAVFLVAALLCFIGDAFRLSQRVNLQSFGFACCVAAALS